MRCGVGLESFCRSPHDIPEQRAKLLEKIADSRQFKAEFMLATEYISPSGQPLAKERPWGMNFVVTKARTGYRMETECVFVANGDIKAKTNLLPADCNLDVAKLLTRTH